MTEQVENPYKKPNPYDPTEMIYSMEGKTWMPEKCVCHHCLEQCEAEGKPYQWGDERYSFGVYAGRHCDTCWPKSGYRDATDPTQKFDPMDAGETMEPEDEVKGG